MVSSRIDEKYVSQIYNRPQGYSNLQWICRIKKILKEYNSMYIDNMVLNPSEDILYFTEKISLEQNILPKKVFMKCMKNILQNEQKLSMN